MSRSPSIAADIVQAAAEGKPILRLIAHYGDARVAEAVPPGYLVVSEADLATALHAAQVRCSPNIPYCRATHKGHAERLFAALEGAQEKGEAGS